MNASLPRPTSEVDRQTGVEWEEIEELLGAGAPA